MGIDAVPAARLAVALRNHIIHGHVADDDGTFYRAVVDDLTALGAALRDWLARLGDRG